MNQLQAIVFDLDDTLYSERDFVLSGFAAVAQWAAENLGIDAEIGNRTLADLYHQGVRNNTFDRWLELHRDRLPADFSIAKPPLGGIDNPVSIVKLLDVYRQHAPTISPFPDAIELLTTLKPSYKIGLVSDGYLEVQQRKWLALGLDRFFDAVVFSDALGRENWKPSTAPFKLVLEKLGVAPEHSVYIGDNPRKDFYGARQLGMHAIQIHRNESEYGHLEPPGADYHPHIKIDSLAAVLTAIEGLVPQGGNIGTI